AAGDPFRARDSRHGPPETWKRKGAQRALKLIGEIRRPAKNVEGFVAVRAVMRLGRDVHVHGGALVEPPEELGAAEGTSALDGAPRRRDVHRLGLNEPVRLLPETHLAGIAKKPAVADDAVLGRGFAREEGGLGGARDGGQNLPQRLLPARARQRAQPRRQRDVPARQTPRVDHNQRLHAGSRWTGFNPSSFAWRTD